MNLEPIAIVGLGCRFPGAQDPCAYWDLLVSGVDAITEVPPDRWSVDHFYHRDIDAPGKTITKWGGFIEDPGGFDAAFFRVSPKEAERIDPQQRLVLEVAWEALEDACIAADGLSRMQGFSWV
jgi:myxalamid-type polyketide synthase MxaE and MxaD